MEDRFTKYTRLYILIFLLFLAVPVIFGLIIALLAGVSNLISSRPVDIAFELAVISMPPAIFITAYTIFFKRTKKHPSPIVKIISQIIFVIGIVCSLIILVLTIMDYFKKGHHEISDYYSCSTVFTAGNIGMLFLLAIIQAFTTKKEEDWMEKRRKKELDS